MQRLWMFCLVLLVRLPIAALAEEDAQEKLTAEECQELIAKLVSPNRPATTISMGEKPGEYAAVLFPRGYDVKAQERIDEVRHKLQSHVVEALPFLINAQADKRYCMTVESFSAYVNEDVGSICTEIMQSNFEVYRDTIHFDGPGRWHKYDYEPIDRKWYQNGKDLVLAELQAWAFKWAMEVNRFEVRKSSSSERRRFDFDQEFAELQKIREQLKTSGKPLPPRDLNSMIIEDDPPEKPLPKLQPYRVDVPAGPQG